MYSAEAECFYCGEYGHLYLACPHREADEEDMREQMSDWLHGK